MWHALSYFNKKPLNIVIFYRDKRFIVVKNHYIFAKHNQGIP